MLKTAMMVIKTASICGSRPPFIGHYLFSSHVKVGLFDNDGVMRGKYMSREKFFSSLDNGFTFCDVVLGWDFKDNLYDNVTYTGWHTGYPDAPVKVLPDSCRDIPFEKNMLLFLVELREFRKHISDWELDRYFEII